MLWSGLPAPSGHPRWAAGRGRGRSLSQLRPYLVVSHPQALPSRKHFGANSKLRPGASELPHPSWGE